MSRHRREISVALASVALFAVLAIAAPGYFSGENLNDLFLANLPVLVVALGMTLIVLTGEIDISVGSQFALCSVAAGVLAKAGLPSASCRSPGPAPSARALGAINGALVAYVRIPSIVVTLAAMVALRDGLRWATEGRLGAGPAGRFSMVRAQSVGLSRSGGRDRRRTRRRRSDGDCDRFRRAARSTPPDRIPTRRASPDSIRPPSSVWCSPRRGR